MRFAHLAFAFTAMAVAAACNDRPGPTDVSLPRSSAPLLAAGGTSGVVATLSNAPGGNQLLLFPRAGDGSLGSPRMVATGGSGTGGGLGSQGALATDLDRHTLYTVNAGSDQISVFRIRGADASLIQTVASGGRTPISLTLRGSLLYALNAGGTGNIAGFSIYPDGRLHPLSGSSQGLSGTGVAPAQISFTPDGHFLTVTEKGTARIDLFPVGPTGLAGPAVVNASSGPTPFGFSYAGRGVLVVSEAAGGAAGASTASSYLITGSGALVTRTASLPTGQTAICWIATTHSGRYAYGTNTGSANVTGFRVNHDGRLSLLSPSGVSGMTGSGTSPIDAAVTRGDRFLYVLNAGSPSITGFQIDPQNGALAQMGGAGGLPTGGAGLVAW